MRICFISPFPPRHDGISEFNQDLIHGLQKSSIDFTYFGVAINQNNEKCSQYDTTVQFQIRKDVKQDYIDSAAFINASKADIVCLELEYALYGGYDGKYIEILIKNLHNKPFVIVHGLPINSYSRRKLTRKKLFQNLDSSVGGFIVINPIQKQVLLTWGIKAPIKQIWHGAPDDIVTYAQKESRAKIGLKNEMTILNFGLFHRKKGLEYLIDGFAQFLPLRPNAKLLLCGKMLVTEKKADYFNEITSKISSLGIQKNVIIVNKYFQKSELYTYLSASDVVVYPYIKRDLVSSGPLSFSVLANKYIITTPFPYAKALLPPDCVYFVPYHNSKEITSALQFFVNNPLGIIERRKKLKKIADHIYWSQIAQQYYDFFISQK